MYTSAYEHSLGQLSICRTVFHTTQKGYRLVAFRVRCRVKWRTYSVNHLSRGTPNGQETGENVLQHTTNHVERRAVIRVSPSPTPTSESSRATFITKRGHGHHTPSHHHTVVVCCPTKPRARRRGGARLSRGVTRRGIRTWTEGVWWQHRTRSDGERSDPMRAATPF